MRCNKFMIDQDIFRQIEKQMRPIIEAQNEINVKVDQLVTGPYRILRDQVDELDLAVFGHNE